MKIYRTLEGCFVEDKEWGIHPLQQSLDELLVRDDLHAFLSSHMANSPALAQLPDSELKAPIHSQEVWASGVTYYRSRNARMEEAKNAGGGDFYDRVYTAERPELFFKAVPHRVSGPNDKVRIRRDAAWSVPEPELTLVIDSRGNIVGYTIGNDMSSRDIEGENPLYLPQAKVYDGSCALGPAILVAEQPLPSTTHIELQIHRGSALAFAGSITLAELKRDPKALVEYLYREMSFPHGCFLMTGTGIVPPDSFTLQRDDKIRITIAPIGTLVNSVA